MKYLKNILCVVAFGLLIPSLAQAGKPIQLALWPPAQLVPEDQGITGLRLEFYGRNADVTGLSIGLVHETTGELNGVDLGVVSLVDKDAYGLQWSWIYSHVGGNCGGWSSGLFSKIDGHFCGLQTSVVSLTAGEAYGAQLSWIYNLAGEHITGLQLGLVNRSEDVNGVQIGLVNLTNKMHGFQIGLWNQIDDKETWYIIPLVNWKF